MNTIDQLIDTIREQHKEGSDFVEIYETGRDRFRDGQFTSQYQYQKPSSRHGSAPRPFGLWRYGDFWYLPERLFESKRVDNL